MTSWPFAHQSPHAGSVCDDLNTISSSIQCNMGSCVSSSHPVVTAFNLRFTNAAAMLSQPHTGKCPVSRPHTEKMAWRVSMSGTFRRSPSRYHLSLLPNLYAQHTSATTQLFWIFVSQPKQFKKHLHLSCRTYTPINKYVIDVWRSSTIESFILPDHSFCDGPHDLWSYV